MKLERELSKQFTFAGRQIKVSRSFEGPGGLNLWRPRGHWLSRLQANSVIDRNRLHYSQLSSQYFIGDPRLAGKNLAPASHSIRQAASNDLIIDFSTFLNGENLYNMPTGWIGANAHEGTAQRWLGEEVFAVGDMTRIGQGFGPDGRFYASKPYTSTVYDWRTIGTLRGARGTEQFEIGNKYLDVSTDSDMIESTNRNFFFYDNDIAFWRVYGNDGCFAFEHIHPLRRKGVSHDDFHRGHWVMGCLIEGERNIAVMNIHQDLYISGSLASDTWGDVFKVRGTHNLFIVNVWPGANFELRGEFANPGFEVEGSNLAIINVFGNGRFSYGPRQ